MGKPSKWTDASDLFSEFSLFRSGQRGCCRDWTILFFFSQSIQANFRSVCTHHTVSFVHKFTAIIKIAVTMKIRLKGRRLNILQYICQRMFFFSHDRFCVVFSRAWIWKNVLKFQNCKYVSVD